MKTKRSARSFAAAAAVIVAAYLCHMINYPHVPLFLSLLRGALHLSLFTAWGFSVKRRILQKETRWYLIAVSIPMILWTVLKTAKYYFVADLHITRYLWYLYYAPLIFIPLFWLFTAISLGKPENYRLPKWTRLLYIPAVLLFLMVITNDLHQWVFTFPADEVVWTDQRNGYGFGYWLIVGLDVAFALGAIVVLAAKCRMRSIRKRCTLPLVLMGLLLLYMALYLLRVPFIRVFARDMACVFCLSFVAIAESCIQCRLIPSNTGYEELFDASVDVSAQIVDRDYSVRYAARSAEKIPAEQMRQAESAPVVLTGGKCLHNAPIAGGHVIWTEDRSALLRVRDELEQTQEELQERGALLQYEYEREKEHKVIEEQNRLYDLLQRKTQNQLDRISRLVNEYQAADGDKRRILSEIMVLGSFIKRRKDLVLSLDSVQTLPEGKLTSALQESFRALAMMKVKGSFLVRTGREYLPGALLTLAYDFFEDVIETVLDTLHFVNVRVCPVNGCLRISILVDCSGEFAALQAKYPQAVMEENEDGTSAMLPLEGSGAA